MYFRNWNLVPFSGDISVVFRGWLVDVEPLEVGTFAAVAKPPNWMTSLLRCWNWRPLKGPKGPKLWGGAFVVFCFVELSYITALLQQVWLFFFTRNTFVFDAPFEENITSVLCKDKDGMIKTKTTPPRWWDASLLAPAFHVPPPKTNMVHLKMKRRFLLTTIIFRFHVSFRGSILYTWWFQISRWF